MADSAASSAAAAWFAAPFDAVVLAGGRARRLGGASKPDVLIAGRRLIDRTLEAARGARDVVVVGPSSVAPGMRVTIEDPPGSGPVAGLAAGLSALPGGAALVLVLACDLPGVAGAVPDLVSAVSADGAVDGALLVDVDGRRQSLAAVYRRAALDAALARLVCERGDLVDASMRRLIGGLTLVEVADLAGRGADIDTWADVAGWARSRDRGA